MDKLIITPFNGVYFACWGITVLAIIAIWAIFKNKSEKAKKIFITVFCALTVVIFFVYKGFLSVDKEFLEASTPKLDKFNWFNELPLQLCNINMFLIPIGVLTNKKYVKGFAFLVAPLGATMALIFAESAFSGYSLLMPRIMGYYVTHFFIVIAGISVATLGFYKPRYRDIAGISALFLIIAFFVHCINLIFRATGLCTYADYFYTIDDLGISILVLFHKLIKAPFFYLIPALGILWGYMGILCLGFDIDHKIKKKKRLKKENEQSDQLKEKVTVSK